VREGEAGVLGHPHLMAGAQGSSQQRERDARQPWRGTAGAWRTRRHSIEHVACVAVGKVEADLGRLRTESANGPKTKLAAHTMLYVFH
jgi:hypothetical protein